MARGSATRRGEESIPLSQNGEAIDLQDVSGSRHSFSSASTTSMIFEHVSDKAALRSNEHYHDEAKQEEDLEEQLAWKRQVQPVDRKARRVLYMFIAIGIVGWIAALFLFLGQDRRIAHSARPHNPHATSTIGHGKKVTLDQVLTGQWRARHHAIAWILGPKGEDGLLLERGGSDGRDYLVVEDVRHRGDSIEIQKAHSTTLMKSGTFRIGDNYVNADEAWPSPNHEKVLLRSNYKSNWRHSGTGNYFIFDVKSQTAEPLDKDHIWDRVQVASWSPTGDAVVFTRDNNMYLRKLDTQKVRAITTDGGPELFYGVPDWVYEEEVLGGNSATWWSGDGKYLAFFKTDEKVVPTFPVQFYFSRPSGQQPGKGEENYPETRQIKYPKAGAPMSTVNLQFYDISKGEVFTVPIEGDFKDNDRLITEVIWAGKTGKVIVRETNRESDVLKTILIDAERRNGKTVRERDIQKLDGGWFEITESTTFVPSDPAKGRPHDGYIDTVVHNNWDHIAYFTPLDNPEPIMLTEGEWETDRAPSAVDLDNNLVYFRATKDGSTQRHVYTVDLLKKSASIIAVTDTSEIGYYTASFSAASKFMLLSYQGPHIPWQKVLSTPSNKEVKTDILIEKNERLNELAKQTELPLEVYDTVTVDGFKLNVVERRPPHFNKNRKYPVLFFLYNGPGFQHVDRQFTIDFQSYVASSLGYVVVTLDARGTGFMGRKHRCAIRGNLGYWEAHDQIAAAKIWSKKNYVDADRMAIWGWSYGGFMTMKVLETDAGQTFKYGMAVAPVTDWRFYDSVYTERYMHTPQHNPDGYNNATISNATALGQNVRFLVMHGASDDNVHFQNTLSLLDKLDLASVSNYDVHIFPDSDHGIYFHNGNRMVYHKLSDWLVNAFNGEWLKVQGPRPVDEREL